MAADGEAESAAQTAGDERNGEQASADRPAQSATADAPKASLRTKVLALGLSSLFGVLLLEIVLRIYNPLHLPLRGSNIVLPVNKTFTYRNAENDAADEVVVNSYNSLGFRGEEPPPDFDTALTVLTIGGSTTACVGLTDGNAWPDLLSEELAIDGLWINNAGMDGHSTFGHLQLLEQYVADLKPDYVLYLVGINDVGRDDLNEYDRSFTGSDRTVFASIVASSELLSTIQVLVRTMRAVDLGVNHHPDLDVRQAAPSSVSESEIEQTLSEHRRRFVGRYRDRLQELATATTDAGIQPIFVTQPALYGPGIDPTTGMNLEALTTHDGSNSGLKWRTLELYNDALREMAQERELLLVDLATEMPKDSTLYFDWIHFSPAGARQVARIVAQELRSRLQN